MITGIDNNSSAGKSTVPAVRRCRRSRRGTVLVAIVAFLLLSEITVMGLVLNTARHQYLAVDRLDTIRAFYASEGGMNMAIREVMINNDEDGDGVVGTISDDSNSTNDPSIGDGTTFVTSQLLGSVQTLTSNGLSGNAIRQLQATLQY